VDFNIRMAKEYGRVKWHLTIPNKQTIIAIKTWVSEMTTELVRAVNFDNLAPESANTMNVAKSLNNKIAQALANPIWEKVTVRGLVIKKRGYYAVETDSGTLRITGEHKKAAGILLDKYVIAEGYIKDAGKFELLNAHEKRSNTLEVFVMSHCPYSVMTESAILNHLDTLSDEETPVIEFRYLFYDNPTSNGLHLWWALHDEPEIEENLVQIVLRDQFPEHQTNYLQLRASDLERTWMELAAEVGLKDEEIKGIEMQIVENRNAIIENEFLYATQTYGLYDGSPSFIWEGERVLDLREIEAFREIDFTRNNCQKTTQLK
jgi:hypothetical protein